VPAANSTRIAILQRQNFRIGSALTATGDGQLGLAEDASDGQAPALYCYDVAQHSHVQVAFYFDDEGDLALAKRIWRSLHETQPS
jgi:hypothetical protein